MPVRPKIKLNLTDRRPSLQEYGTCLFLSGGWLVALSTTGYPVGEWIGVVVVSYITFVVSRVSVGILALHFIVRPFNRHYLRVLEQLREEFGIDVDKMQQQAKLSPAAWLPASLFIVSWIGAVVGLSLTFTHLVMIWVDFPSLGPAFGSIALWLLTVSAVVAPLTVLFPHLIFRQLDAHLNHRATNKAIDLKFQFPGRIQHLSRVWLTSSFSVVDGMLPSSVVGDYRVN